jgi:endo-1,4-beta-xylanase
MRSAHPHPMTPEYCTWPQAHERAASCEKTFDHCFPGSLWMGHGGVHCRRAVYRPRNLTWTACVLVALGGGDEGRSQPLASDGESLREACPRFVVGVAVEEGTAASYSAKELSLLERHFSCLTPENCMKMEVLQPVEGHFDFSKADAFVDFAEARGLKVCGHTLVWAKDNRTPAWVFRDGDKPASRELVLARMRTHIKTVVNRYRGRIAAWDVVNEALDDGSHHLRPSGWEKVSGTDFIEEAFRCAHECDPGATLIYNDYDTERPEKRRKLVHLIGDLQGRGVPIHAVGIQGHWEVGRVPLDAIDEQFNMIRNAGLKAVVSELDLSVVPRSKWWADGGAHREELAKTDPYPSECPESLVKQQADEYRMLFGIFRRHSETISRITFWNLHDGRSWLNTFPWRRADYPLLFDRQCEPKPAFYAILKEMAQE